MKNKILLSLSFLLLLQITNAHAQTAKEMRTVKTPLVVNGKWVQSSYDYDAKAGEYYFVDAGKRVLFDDHFKTSKDYINNTIYVDMKTIHFAGKAYEKYGLPRILGLDDVSAIGKYNGMLVMAEKGISQATPDIIWIPHSASMGAADFQAYHLKK